MEQVQQSIQHCIEALTRTTDDEAVLLALEGANCKVLEDGHVIISLLGKDKGPDGHKDASRLIGSAVSLAYFNSGMQHPQPGFSKRELKGNEPGETFQLIQFNLLPGSEAKFVDALDAMTKKIETTQPLRLEIDRGIRYSRKYVSKIPGAKAYVTLSTKNDGEITANLRVSGLSKNKLSIMGVIAREYRDAFTAMLEPTGDISVPLEYNDTNNYILHALKVTARATERAAGDKEGPGGGRG